MITSTDDGTLSPAPVTYKRWHAAMMLFAGCWAIFARASGGIHRVRGSERAFFR
jgi:hypothetical protein